MGNHPKMAARFRLVKYYGLYAEDCRYHCLARSHAQHWAITAAPRGYQSHIAQWFGKGHQYVWLQANHDSKFGKKQARTLLLRHLQHVQAQNVAWHGKLMTNGRRRRTCSKIYAVVPGIGLYHAC